MLGFLVWVSLGLVIVASIDQHKIHQHWQKFKRAHGKSYHPGVDQEKKQIFAENVKKIMEHNILADLGHRTHKMGISKYSDMSHEEFVKTMNGLKGEALELQTRSNNPNLHQVLTRAGDLPKQVDWSKEGGVTPVKDQGECGSCWSFSATGAMEGAWFRKTGQLVSLSEQNLVDCARDGNDGCDGGLPHNAFQYVIDRQGVDKETCYPYYGMQFKCFYNPTCIGANITEFKMIESGDENALKEAVASVGPISIAIDASHESLQHYKEGIYSEPNCNPENLDHAVLLVGYGTNDDGLDYWLIKNSWSESWGINGYFKMARNKNNTCGVASYGTYPIA